MINTLFSWLKAFYSFFMIPHPKPVPAPTKLETLTNIIMSFTRDFGPSIKTGGYLKAIDRPTATEVAAAILKFAPLHNFEPEFVAAGIAGESRFDPHATNPNKQDATPGESVEQARMHLDCGLGQFDYATVQDAQGIFSDLKGLTSDQIVAHMYDLEWAAEHYCMFLAKLFADTKNEVDAEPTLLDNVPNKDIRILSAQAYNAGLHGAAHLAHTKGDFSYAVNWLDRYAQYKELMKDAK